MGKDCGSDLGKSDELISPKPTSEGDNCNTNKNLEFNEIEMVCPELVKGLKFGDVATFRATVYRARKSAEKVIDGDGDDNEQYNRIWDYYETLKATNVGTTTLMLVDRPTLDVAGIFQRLYICLQATKEGFKARCRPLIGLDGCFLKGNQKGQILSVVGRDANDNMYSIIMAIVEIESKDSWSWFLDCLLKDLGPVEQHGWAFILDRQKGLIQSFDVVCPMTDHRSCVRHLYANYRDKGHKGKALKDKLWVAVTTYTELKKWVSLRNCALKLMSIWIM